ncbi:hypothetical protein DM02DRAFT_550559 [Periconia macrospinosa]|uniref:Uncharacterized protein n=1 Tax=Periconia macrospinosa TaxID=97972 RepID=A0A2V1EC13_9PLEO|nr:hypothetical protein DM02DRAFT_550559 [Periconia macrospinosa]
MADYPTVLSTILYILWWPTNKFIHVIKFILSPIWALVRFIFLPVTYLLETIFNVILFPFRINVLERIETIYIWLGIAALVGCITGAILYLIYRGLTSAFSIDATTSTEPQKATKGKTIEEYRAARRERRGKGTDDSSSPTATRHRVARRRNLSSFAIMEEESEF